jgi:lycopene beta-cyclase
MRPSHDYIFTGGGLAGLSLIMHILEEPALRSKSILLIDQDAKKLNDRTWCFWERGEGFFDRLLYRSWTKAWFHALGYSALKDLGNYKYKMIRGIDFYEHCHAVITASGRVDVVQASVTALSQDETGVSVQAGDSSYTGTYLFNSIIFPENQVSKKAFPLLQHFKGWVIETDYPAFDPESATLMDFRVDQSHGTTFVYVMPFSSKKALVEYTLFTPALLDEQGYKKGLKNYIESYLQIPQYKIVEEEFGVIPMTDHHFSPGHGKMVNLGTAGGQTKPSSGYTFRFIQKHSALVVKSLVQNKSPIVSRGCLDKRFFWYDKVLLHMLYFKKMSGARIFRLLFKRNPIQRIFRFLDNETKIHEELILLNTLPQWPFMKAGWKELLKPKPTN